MIHLFSSLTSFLFGALTDYYLTSISLIKSHIFLIRPQLLYPRRPASVVHLPPFPSLLQVQAELGHLAFLFSVSLSLSRLLVSPIHYRRVISSLLSITHRCLCTVSHHVITPHAARCLQVPSSAEEIHQVLRSSVLKPLFDFSTQPQLQVSSPLLVQQQHSMNSSFF